MKTISFWFFLMCAFLIYRHWLTEREDTVDAKGKGQMTTFWCEPNGATGSVFSGTETSQTQDCLDDAVGQIGLPEEKLQQLVEWNVSMFAGLLEEIALFRDSEMDNRLSESASAITLSARANPVNEVQEGIDLMSSNQPWIRPNMECQLSETAMAQLRDLISSIARLYQSNSFHSFEHCSHVVMSTKKMLNRITDHEKDVKHKTRIKDSCTYGITSNPLHQFAIMFAALIHDMDHSGVSNAQLMEESHPLSHLYNGKSVAEQNSIDVAWKLLMEPQFANLRNCIYTTEAEIAVFRQILVNAVMATDLFDKDLKNMREARWLKTFSSQPDDDSKASLSSSSDTTSSRRKAAIVIDLIIQASDVSHTMQHFTVYKKWNMKLLTEMYTAYQNGRMTKDPTEGWYEGELWFFDNYIIPLAQKLRECQVFGVSCDEFLDYAKDNRAEWEVKGRDIVQEVKVQLQLLVLQSNKNTIFEL
jgi:3'5'-cyclic nucleotide phosphodiesterase